MSHIKKIKDSESISSKLLRNIYFWYVTSSRFLAILQLDPKISADFGEKSAKLPKFRSFLGLKIDKN